MPDDGDPTTMRGVDRAVPQDEVWLQRGRIPSLDGLRAIAIGLVLLTHTRATTGFPAFRPLDLLGRVGPIGVEIFFVISGFLITLLMLRELQRFGRLDLRAFYLRRILRILPAFAVLLLVVAILQQLGLASPSRRDWLLALTYTMNLSPTPPAWELGHIWSLSIEEHFYLVWPVVVALAPARWRSRLALGAMVLAFAGRWILILLFPSHAEMIRGWTPLRIDSIAAGCLLACWAWEPGARATLNRIVHQRWIQAGVLAVLLGSLWLRLHPGRLEMGLCYTTTAAALALMIWWAISHPHLPAGRILNHSWIVAIGTLSYSLYLWQELFLHPFRHHWWTAFPQNVVLALLVASLSYYLIESPFLRLKDRLGATRHRTVAFSESQGRCATLPAESLHEGD